LCEHGQIRRGGDLHFRAQPVDRKPFGKAFGLPGPQIDCIAILQLVQEEVPQDLALRRQQRPIADPVPLDPRHVERQNIMQQLGRIRS
jgi:hypothetical protein